MSYETERMTSVHRDDNVVAKARIRSRLFSARWRRSNSFSLPLDVQDMHLNDSPNLINKVDECLDVGESTKEFASSTITWSPLPDRKPVKDNLCVALFCDDTWANIEKFDNLIDSLPGNETPTPAPSSASSTLKRKSRPKLGSCAEFLLDSFEKCDEPLINLEDDLEPVPSFFDSPQLPMRPFTNPRDTPTHHPPLLQSPSRKLTSVGKDDLTLESLHDLNWLQRMEPDDQVILEVHIIWSILTLMVVLLACYSVQHHSL